ncbi:MAG: hypothetical protein MI723_08750, partial [Caulobacterales bacterium]|nr:hypothetical protein [Caulobacterales bacterium]
MRGLDARLLSVRGLLSRQEYAPGVLQHAYRWGPRELDAFWRDAAGPSDKGAATSARLLGGIIAHRAKRQWVVEDGCERLTSIVLTLIALIRRLGDKEPAPALTRLIARPPRWRQAHGFAWRREPDEAILSALLAHGQIVAEGADAHARRIAARYEELEQKIDARFSSDKQAAQFAERFIRQGLILRIAARGAFAAQA